MGPLGWWGRFVYRRRWVVLAVSVLTLGASVASLLSGGQLRNVQFRDTEAGRANQLLRDEFPPVAGVPAAATSSFVLIFTSTAGLPAADPRFIDAMNAWLPIVFVFVLGLSFVLVTVVFRSIVIAATSIALNLLSVGAAYGLVVLVFRHGIGSGLLGFQRIDAIEAWVPLFLFSVLFGLSMDYQVFLLSRIKERYDRTGSTTDAVVHGVSSTARLITGAALIIVAVFSGFAMGDLVMFQQMGFGIAVALLIDATIIRSVLLPAAMRLLDSWNWYLPRWLEWLPRIQIEAQRRDEHVPLPSPGR
jgi:RND superfamily putative drug exporter